MQYTTFLLLTVLATAATTSWLIVRRAIFPTAMLSVALWGMLALRARSLTRYFQDGTSATVEEPAFQYIALGLAILSFGVIVLWYFGEYPPDEPDELDPEGEPITEGV